MTELIIFMHKDTRLSSRTNHTPTWIEFYMFHIFKLCLVLHRKGLRKEKKRMKNDYLIFSCIIKNMKEN